MVARGQTVQVDKLLEIGEVIEDDGKIAKIAVRFGGEKYVYTVDKKYRKVLELVVTKRSRFFS